MKRLVFVSAVVAVCAVAGCRWGEVRQPPVPTAPAAVETAPVEVAPVVKPVAAVAETAAPKDDLDVEKIFKNPWLIAVVFLLIQWFEIWYYNRTGKTSATIDAAEAALSPKLGIMQRVLYRLWRWRYFSKHPDRADPDKDNKETKK